MTVEQYLNENIYYEHGFTLDDVQLLEKIKR